jgi:polysaccharide chain length determinant protein (PEP-CTERM system associated)
VLRRRAWHLVIPTLAALALGFVYAQAQPNRYRSSAVIQVTPPQLPSAVVRPMVTMSLRERLPMLEQEVLSRARLERIITDFDLYRAQRAEDTMEDVVNQMRRDINVGLPRNTGRKAEGLTFSLSYSSLNPRTAFQVAERLVGLFVDENARQRETIAEGNDQFLAAEVEAARVRLEETESRLEAYKKQYGGQLPEQMQANMAALTNTQTQIQSMNEAIARDRSETLIIQRELSDLTGEGADGSVVNPVEATNITTPYDEPLAKARATLQGLEMRLTADHPDVVRQRRTVSELEERVQSAQLQRPVSGTTTGSTQSRVSQAELARRNRINELRRREQLLEQQIANRQREVQSRQSQAGTYQSRLDGVPAREAEMIGLVRDYETLKNRYATLLQRSEEAKVAANMERRQVSEQFRITEPPRVPEQPYSPDRQRLTLLGAALGLALAVLVVGILEYRDSTFRTDQDLVQALALPVVAVIPTMLTSSERRERRRRRMMLSTGGVAALVVAGAVLFWKFGL